MLNRPSFIIKSLHRIFNIELHTHLLFKHLIRIMMDLLPELGSQDLVELTPAGEHFDEFGNIDPVVNLQSVFALSDETLDAATAVQLREFKPVSPLGPPIANCTPGRANFCVEVASNNVNKKKFLYSYKVGRVYVDKDCNFSLYFNWDVTQTLPDMYVRATVVFSDVEQSEKRVERCLQHFHESPSLPNEIAKNVLHSSREIGTQGVYYCGDVTLPDSWYSVLVHYHKTTPEPCTHAYKFGCKNSCVSGINRRAIAIIFTLEDQSGEVYGRQKVGVKVCACPRRDMQKDEEAIQDDTVKGGKRKITNDNVTKTKKIKLETQDTPCVMVPFPKLSASVELNSLLSGLRTITDNMTNVCRHSPQYVDTMAGGISALKKTILDLERQYNNIQNNST